MSSSSSTSLVGKVCQAVRELGNLKPKEGEVISIIHDIGGVEGRGDPSLALQYFYFVKYREGFQHSSHTYWTMITVLLPDRGKKRLKHIKSMLEQLRVEGQATQDIYERIMKAYAYKGNLGDAMWVVNCFKGDQVPWCDISNFCNLLMKVLLDCNWNAHVLAAGTQIGADLGSHDATRYSYMIRAAAKEGQFQTAEQLMVAMSANGMFISATEFGAVINMFAKARIVERAIYWFDYMRQLGMQHDNRTFNAMLRAYLETGRMIEARNIVNAMLSNLSTVPNSHTVAMILGCTAPSHYDKMHILQLTQHRSYGLLYPGSLTIGMRKHMQLLHRREKDDGTKRTVDCVVNYLHMSDEKEQARFIWDEAMILKTHKLIRKIPHTSTNEIDIEIDLHGLAVGTAQIALSRTLLQISDEVLNQSIPMLHKLTVITGWGLHSSVQGVSSLREAINSLLLASHFPMAANAGSFSGEGADLHEWLTQPTPQGSRIVETMHML